MDGKHPPNKNFIQIFQTSFSYVPLIDTLSQDHTCLQGEWGI